MGREGQGEERIKEGPPQSPTKDARARTHAQHERGEWGGRGKVCVGRGDYAYRHCDLRICEVSSL